MWFIVSQEGATGIAVANSVMTRCLDLLKGFATLECPKLDGGCYITEADLLANEGISIPMEAHNESDFVIRIRYGRGQMRKLEIKPDRNISIVAPGGWKISGLRMQ